jgi:hypothetical protein
MKTSKHLFLTVLTLVALAAGAWAQTSDTTAPAPKKRHKPVTAAKAEPAITAADVQALKDGMAAQQQQIQQLTQQLQQAQLNWQQAQAAATDAANKAAAAQAQSGQEEQTVGQLKGDVADLKMNLTSTSLTLQETQKSTKAALESPLTLHFRGVTLTPGGYLDGTFTRRSRALAEEAATPFNSIQMPGAAQGTMSEFFGSGRQSRISLLTQGKLDHVTFTGYVEADFLSAGVTSNNNSTNGYTLRQRQNFGQAAFDNGWTFTGGQQWSLITETGHGMDNRTEAVPLTIDSAYNVGFSYARQYGLRITKNVSNKVYFGVSMESAQATVTTHGNAPNWVLGTLGDSKAYNTLTTYSFNPSPDIVGKLVFEPGFGHYEVFGVYSRFRDRVYPCQEDFASAACGNLTAASTALVHNASKNGGGFGANARWAFAEKRLIFGLHGFGGSGVGRYGTTGLPDASVHADGTLHLVREFQGLATLEWRGKKLDIYSNVGSEYASRTWDLDPVSGKQVGFGAPTFDNSGCFTETLPGTSTTFPQAGGFQPGALAKCNADTRAAIEGSIGFWYRFYKGPKGTFQYGTQYSYATRNTWSGVGGDPHGIDSMIFSTFRYYLP